MPKLAQLKMLVNLYFAIFRDSYALLKRILAAILPYQLAELSVKLPAMLRQ